MKLFTVFAFVSVCCGILAAVGCGITPAGQTLALSIDTTPSKQVFTPLPADPLAGDSAEDALIAAAKARTAPELGDGQWINSEPQKIKNLRGQVVYIEFWTFSCYNCLNTLPTVKRFDEKYRDKGLTIIGVQSPEFEREKDIATITRSVNKLGVKYPVVTDNEMKTWDAYRVNAWPTIVILDKEGRIRYRHVGEGAYDTQQRVIETLLVE